MSFQPLDVVVLNTDLPAQGLKRGDLGAVVDIYAPDAIEIEFVTGAGRTRRSSPSSRATSARSGTMTSSPVRSIGNVFRAPLTSK